MVKPAGDDYARRASLVRKRNPPASTGGLLIRQWPCTGGGQIGHHGPRERTARREKRHRRATVPIARSDLTWVNQLLPWHLHVRAGQRKGAARSDPSPAYPPEAHGQSRSNSLANLRFLEARRLGGRGGENRRASSRKIRPPTPSSLTWVCRSAPELLFILS